MNLTPKQIVEKLDKYVIGQQKAKKAVAIALRNRYRRSLLPPKMQEEVIPKNILMIGPTGVGKTEIARRLAKMAEAPFLKVEATKFTEVGYVGRDVESIIRDLLQIAVHQVKRQKTEVVLKQAEKLANEKILAILSGKKSQAEENPLNLFLGGMVNNQEEPETSNDKLLSDREKLFAGELDDQMIEIEVDDSSVPVVEVFSNAGMDEMGLSSLQDAFSGLFPKRKKLRKVTVKEARKIFTQEEAQKLIDFDEVVAEAIKRTEQSGIVFIDEIDKIAGKNSGSSPDVSREGVQRDILPIVEGSTVMTKHGAIKTDHILFIGAGAFHVAKPSDLIPELQGRFPIRVELESLTEEDFEQILTKPENALLKQYSALLATEGVELNFAPEAIREIARIACYVNQENENIGARRLHTILESLLEEISYAACEIEDKTVTIDKNYVMEKLQEIRCNEDMSRYIL